MGIGQPCLTDPGSLLGVGFMSGVSGVHHAWVQWVAGGCHFVRVQLAPSMPEFSMGVWHEHDVVGWCVVQHVVCCVHQMPWLEVLGAGGHM